MILELERKQVNWALVCNHYIDNRPELEFRSTHNLIWDYLVENFEPATTNIRPDCELMRRVSSNNSLLAQPVRDERLSHLKLDHLR